MTMNSSPGPATQTTDRLAAAKMHQTFAGFVGEIGDTQPMDTQQIDEYRDVAASKRLSNIGTHAYTFTGGESDDTHSIHLDEGEFFDLRGISIEPRNADDDALSLIASDLEDCSSQQSPKQQHGDNAMFKTPAIAGRKRDCRGEVISPELTTSTVKTSGSALAAMFGSKKVAHELSLTQVFQGTQVASSPAPGAPWSDPVFQRPSPNIHLQDSIQTAQDFSSPLKQFRGDAYWAGSDPVETYLPMKESQERRLKKQRAQEELGTRRDREEADDFENTFLAGDRTTLHQKARQKMLETKTSDVTQLIEPDSHLHKPGMNFPAELKSDWTLTPPTVRRPSERTVAPIAIPDVVEEEDEDYTANDDGVRNLAIEVPRTSSRPSILTELPCNVASSPSGHARRAVGSRVAKENSASSKGAQLENENDPGIGTQQTVAVADSQRDATQQYDSLPRPNTQMPSSSIVNPGSTQFQQSLTKSERDQLDPNVRAAMDATSIPPPILRSSQFEETMIPSSPPAAPHLTMQATNQSQVSEQSEGEIDLVGSTKINLFLGAMDGSSAEGPPRNSHEEDERAHGLSTRLDSRDQLSGIQEAYDRGTDRNGSQLPKAATNASGADIFDTAQSHLSRSQEKPDHAELPAETSPGRSSIRRLTDIANDPTPAASFELIDLDSLNIITENDREHLAVVSGIAIPPHSTLMSGSSPVQPASRRKSNVAKPLCEPAKNVNVQGIKKPAAAKSQSSESRNASPTSTRSSICRIEKPLTKKYGKAKRPQARKVKPLIRKLQAQNQKPSEGEQRSAHPRKITQTRSVDNTGAAMESEQKADQQSTTGKSDSHGTTRPAQPLADTESAVDSTGDDQTMSFPNRVLALFNGDSIGWYPATCLGISHAEPTKMKIKFDDTTVDFVDITKIAHLSIRVGDQVKVNLRGLKSKTYIVQGFKDKINTPKRSRSTENGAAGSSSHTDVQGYKTLQLSVKPARSSLPLTSEADSTVDVAVTDIYLNGAMFVHFADRLYKHVPTEHGSNELHMGSPRGTADLATPANRPRRTALATVNQHNALELPSANGTRKSSVFENMVFAVSAGEAEDEKGSTERLLREHGAQILKSGFHELFLPAAAGNAVGANSIEGLQLQHEVVQRGFTALIADQYSRRPKYLQALAIGVPCLHLRWVRDSVAANAPLPLDKYLLPAGESSFLGGAIRSRALTIHDPLAPGAELKGIVQNRSTLLKGKTALMVPGKGKNDDREKTFDFLAFALGADRVARPKDLKEAKALAASGHWDFVHVASHEDGDEADLNSILDGTASKKRKSSGRVRKSAVMKEQPSQKPRIVGNEWVIQSLILGSLLD